MEPISKLEVDRPLEEFTKLGLIGPPPIRQRWRSASPKELAGRLRPWTPKQVRTRFERLRRNELITAERLAANGPWHYKLPEAFDGRRSVFDAVPPVEELVAAVAHGTE